MASAMFAPGKILLLREKAQAVVVDINGANPVVTPTAPLSQVRRYANATVLADGKVFINGGSFAGDAVPGAIYSAEIWDPKTGKWASGASAAMPRLYHSASLLPPDGSVLTAGGTTADVGWLNAEIYFPPYLYKTDGSGQLAPRPTISSAPGQELGWNQAINVGMAAGDKIARVTLVRAGAVTHALNNEQRLNELPFTQVGQQVQLKTPPSRNLAPPGFYMLFVINTAGVPSRARMVRINGA